MCIYIYVDTYIHIYTGCSSLTNWAIIFVSLAWSVDSLQRVIPIVSPAFAGELAHHLSLITIWMH